MAFTTHYAYHGVYPRACGGTPDIAGQIYEAEGLSPRVRGNQISSSSSSPVLGSIPARAGEPCSGKIYPLEPRVYPRACGGTLPG